MFADNQRGATLRDRRLVAISVAVVATYSLGFLGLALLPLLARDRPRLLIALNPTTSILLLVSARVDLASFVAVAAARRVILHILCYLLGHWYGQAAVRWVEGRGGRATRLVGLLERAFARVRWLVVMVMPGPVPSVLAGAGRMGIAPFLALDIAGTLGSILLARYAAGVMADPLGAALRFSDDHAVSLTILCVAATTTWLALRWRKRGADRTQR